MDESGNIDEYGKIFFRVKNTEKRIENKMCSGVFLTKFEVFR